jgi:hypothetical protein
MLYSIHGEISATSNYLWFLAERLDRPKDSEGTHRYTWFGCIFINPDLAMICSLQYWRHFLSRWNSTRKTAFNLGTTTGTFPEKIPIRQCTHNSDALQYITFHNKGYFITRTWIAKILPKMSATPAIRPLEKFSRRHFSAVTCAVGSIFW